MSEGRARNIVKRLLGDPDLYREMSERENRIWGRYFSDARRTKRIRSDQAAGQALNLNRDVPGPVAVIQRHGLKPELGLSLACGNGRSERTLMQHGICREFHGMDISALKVARAEAAKAKLNIRYEQADLNDVRLEKGAYDLVVTQNCLHHVLRLEHLAEQIHGCLRPGGVLWIHDYIGETQFQYSDERLEFANAILAILPKKYRYQSVDKLRVTAVQRPEPGALASPFEAIRSGEIMPVFLRWFRVIEKHEYDSILRLVCPQGTRAAFAATEEGRALFELLFLLDRLLIRHGILAPAAGAYLLAPLEGREQQAS